MRLNQGSNSPLSYFQRLLPIINEHILYDVELTKLYQQIDRNAPFKNLQNGFYRGENDGTFRKGKGEWISEDGTLYRIGVWQNNCLQGKGLSLYCLNNIQSENYYECYYGDFNKGKPHGYGKLKKINNQSYEGYWENGLMNGQGSIYIENSYYCKGQFKNNVLCGNGEIESQDETNKWKMVGNFIDCKNFKGEIIYKEGKYFGQALYDQNQWQMHGKGKFIWEDESYYNGSFSYNKRNGYAVSKFGNENQEEMIWKDDRKEIKVEHH